MRNGDLELKNHIEKLLAQDSRVDAAAIGVSVSDAIVSLNGYVNSFLEKQQVSEVVQQIRGVRAVADELEVHVPSEAERSDEQIAHTIASVFSWDARIPPDSIHIQVAAGHVTLKGQVRWPYQRFDAEKIVSSLMGVRGVTNQIEVAKPLHRPTTKEEVHSRLFMSGYNDNLEITVDGDRVRIKGTVHSLADRHAVENAIWAIPGVRFVENDLEVRSVFARELKATA